MVSDLAAAIATQERKVIPWQGMRRDTGLQDACNLGWKLALVLKGKAAPSPLDTYEAERLPVARAVLHHTHRNTFLVQAKNPVLRLVRDHVLVPLLSVEAIEASSAESESQLAISYRASFLSRSFEVPATKEGAAPAWQSAGPAKRGTTGQAIPQAGDRAPDGPCQRALAHIAQTAATLFQEMQGTTWSLLLFDSPELEPSATGVTTMIGLARLAEHLLGDEVKPHLILSRDRRPEPLDWNGSVLLDPDHELHARYGAETATLFLIRPDGYVGLRSHPACEEPLQAYIAGVFTSSPLLVWGNRENYGWDENAVGEEEPPGESVRETPRTIASKMSPSCSARVSIHAYAQVEAIRAL